MVRIGYGVADRTSKPKHYIRTNKKEVRMFTHNQFVALK